MDPRHFTNFRQTICLYLLLSCREPCQSANHYCVNGHTVSIRIGGFYHRDETIIPEIPDEPIDKRGSYRDCSWEIIVDEAGNQNSQIVLEGVNLESADLSGSSNKTQVNILLNRNENVTLGMFQVKPLSQWKHISVQINWDPKTQSRSPVNLRILIPVAGLCSRDMLSFNGSCHAISTVPAHIMKAVERCIGDVSLASFTSMNHINEFIASNKARQEELPYKSPLDLSKWVRLGMFYRAGDGAILSVVKTKSGCQLMEVDKNLFQVSQMRGTCGAFKVNEFDKAEIQFGDCDEPMLALMSFPDTVKSAPSSPLNCNMHLRHETALLLSISARFITSAIVSTATGEKQNHYAYTDSVNSSTLKLIIILAAVAGIILVLHVIVTVLGIYFCERCMYSILSVLSHRGSLPESEIMGQQMACIAPDMDSPDLSSLHLLEFSPI